MDLKLTKKIISKLSEQYLEKWLEEELKPNPLLEMCLYNKKESYHDQLDYTVYSDHRSTTKTHYDCDAYFDWDDWDPYYQQMVELEKQQKLNCECGGMHMDIENHYDFCPMYEAWARKLGIIE